MKVLLTVLLSLSLGVACSKKKSKDSDPVDPEITEEVKPGEEQPGEEQQGEEQQGEETEIVEEGPVTCEGKWEQRVASSTPGLFYKQRSTVKNGDLTQESILSFEVLESNSDQIVSRSTVGDISAENTQTKGEFLEACASADASADSSDSTTTQKVEILEKGPRTLDLLGRQLETEYRKTKIDSNLNTISSSTIMENHYYTTASGYTILAKSLTKTTTTMDLGEGSETTELETLMELIELRE